LDISKTFKAGKYWTGETQWKTSLLVRQIKGKKYLGVNLELLSKDGRNWEQINASYNVTLLDSNSRIVKEFGKRKLKMFSINFGDFY